MAFSLQRYMLPAFDSSLIQLLKESKKEGEKSMGVAIGNGDSLHESVIIEILSWFPVKDLLRWKSVCKSWYAIISSSDFISKHLKNYYKNNFDGHGCLLAQYYLNQCELQLFVLLVDDTPRVLAHENLFHMPMYSSLICGPCDGLYYLFDHFCRRRAIWNPAINELRVLPPLITKPDLPLDTAYSVREVYGFGFDPISRDYKVVVILGYLNTVYWESTDDPQSVLVYSLRNDSWRYCGDLSQRYNLTVNKCYTFVNECCYWLDKGYVCEDFKDFKDYGVIISFNLAIDTFEEINLPNYKMPSFKCLGVYDETLCLLSVHENDNVLEIWILKEGIWIMKFKTNPFLDVLLPIGHWKDNKILLETRHGNLVLLDPESQDSIKDLGFGSPKLCEEVFVYMESLVSIKGENHYGQDQDNNNDTENVSSVIVTSKSDDEEFGIRELFCCELSDFDSDSEFGIHNLFG